MANVEKLSIALTPEMADLVWRAVASGESATTSEVVREALRECKPRHSRPTSSVEDLQLLWEEGLASGPGRFEALDGVKAQGHRRWREPPGIGG